MVSENPPNIARDHQCTDSPDQDYRMMTNGGFLMYEMEKNKDLDIVKVTFLHYRGLTIILLSTLA